MVRAERLEGVQEAHPVARLVDEGVAQVVVDLRAARQRRPQDDDAVVRQVACSRPACSGNVPPLSVFITAAIA